MSFSATTEGCDTQDTAFLMDYIYNNTAFLLSNSFLVLFRSVCTLRDLSTFVDTAVSTATSFVTFMLMHNKYGTDYSLYFIY